MTTVPGAHVEVRRRRWYAAVEIDLWRTAYDLSPEGQELAGERLNAAVSEFFERGGRGSVSYSAGPTFIGASRVLNERAEPLMEELLAIVAAHVVPTRGPFEAVTAVDGREPPVA
jgi:hypothetical protein